jgi:hypothetical protein
MKAIATILRSGRRPPLPQLHHQALSRLASDGQGAYGDVVLSWEPAPAPAAAVQVPGGPVSGGPVSGGSVPGGPVPGGPVPDAPAPAPYRPAPPRPRTPPAQPVTTGTTVTTVTTGTTVITGTSESAGVAETAQVAVAAVTDPHAAITAAVQAERHDEADALAARHEAEAVRVHGPASEQALHWTEVRADLAMFAGDAARSCRTWMAVAGARLAAGQAPDAPAVETAVDRAHHQWGRVDDVARARELGPALAELRHRVPGRREGALRHVQRHLEELRQDPPEVRPAQHVPG